MPVSAATLRALMAAGVHGEALIAVVEAIDADLAASAPAVNASWERRKAWDRDRKRVKAENSTGIPPETPDPLDVPPVVSPAPLPIPPLNPPTPVSRAREDRSPFDELVTTLDAEHASAVVEHRKRMGKGKALTAYSARLLARNFAQCSDPNAAADAMIANGWQGFKPEWLADRSTGPPRSGNGPGKPTMADLWRASTAAAREADERPYDPPERKAISAH